MNCAETKDLLSAYLDSELPDRLRDDVTQHLAACSSCGEDFHCFTAISGMAKSLPNPALPSEIWNSLSRALDGASPHRASHWLGRHWRSAVPAFALLAASVLVLAGIAIWNRDSLHGGHASEAQQFADFARSFPTDPERAQEILLASYNGRAASTEELRKSPRITAVAASNPPAGYALQRAYVLEMSCCQCSQVVLRRPAGGLVSVFEHGDAHGPNWTSGFRCTNMQCGNTPCEIAQTGEHLAVSCRVRDRHFTIVGAVNSREVEALVAWLEAAGTATETGHGEHV